MLAGKMSKNNTSGVVGVCWNKALGLWVARFRGETLGASQDFETAVALRKKAEEQI